jgi:hypothetical protein
VVDAMMFHPTSMLVQLHGCLALAVLWRYPPSARRHKHHHHHHHHQQQQRQKTSNNNKGVFQDMESESNIEDKINAVIPDAVKVVTQALRATTVEKYFGGPSGSTEITANTPLAQAASLAISTLAKTNGHCRYLLAKSGVVDLLLATLRVYCLSVGRISRSKLLPGDSTASTTTKNLDEISESARARGGDSGGGSIATVASPQVASAVLEALGSLALLGCGDDVTIAPPAPAPPLQSAFSMGYSGRFDIVTELPTSTNSNSNLNSNNNNLEGVKDNGNQKAKEDKGSDDDDDDEEDDDETVTDDTLLVSGVKGCVPLVVATMRAHLSRVEVQRVGCLALEGMAYESSHGAYLHLKHHTNNNSNNNNGSGGGGPSFFSNKVNEVDIYELITRAGGLEVIGEARRHYLSDTVIAKVAQDSANRQGKWKYCLIPL